MRGRSAPSPCLPCCVLSQAQPLAHWLLHCKHNSLVPGPPATPPASLPPSLPAAHIRHPSHPHLSTPPTYFPTPPHLPVPHLLRYFWRWLAMFARVRPAPQSPMDSRMREGTWGTVARRAQHCWQSLLGVGGVPYRTARCGGVARLRQAQLRTTPAQPLACQLLPAACSSKQGRCQLSSVRRPCLSQARPCERGGHSVRTCFSGGSDSTASTNRACSSGVHSSCAGRRKGGRGAGEELQKGEGVAGLLAMGGAASLV